MNITGDNEWNLSWNVNDHKNKNGHNLYVKNKKL